MSWKRLERNSCKPVCQILFIWNIPDTHYFVLIGEPNNLTLIAIGGPGDGGTKGLNHLGHSYTDGPSGSSSAMLKRIVGPFYVQVKSFILQIRK